MNKVGSKELSKHVTMKPKPKWQFKFIIGCTLLFSTILLSLLGAVTVGRALMGIIAFTSLVIPINNFSWTLFNLGTMILTLYVFYRLYKFHDYILNKIYLFVFNTLAAIKLTEEVKREDRKNLKKEK